MRRTGPRDWPARECLSVPGGLVYELGRLGLFA